uniref:Uncharacterized protein n=1 Tax=Sphaerodactylus townsendi TaxID=933632 RepID=A0ACB8FVP7_9SAUR
MPVEIDIFYLKLSGWQNSSHENCQSYENRNISSNEDNKQVGNSLPKSISTRRRYLKIDDQRELCVSDDNNLEITDQIIESCEQDKTRPERDLVMNNEQFEEMYPYTENTNDTSPDQSLVYSHMPTECSSSTTDLKETHFNNSNSQTQKDRGQKRKLEEVKKRSRTRSKKKNRNKHSGSKGKADLSVGSSDAYDFIFEESVHITPFRQNKEKENTVDDNSCIEEICSDSSSDDDSNDSLYEPYKNKSKSMKTLSHRSDTVPVHTRRQSKRAVLEQHERTTEEKMCKGKSNTSVTKNSGSNVVMNIAEDVPCSIFTEENKEKEHKTSSFSENINFKPDKPLGNLQNFCHLGDITNLASSSTITRNSHPLISSGEKETFNNRRRCTVSMSYKEPALNRKLRRGDPFTDVGLLDSPIFKEKKMPKYTSVKKKFVSRYNEAFVGCL